MNTPDFVTKLLQGVKRNSPELLTAAAAVGVVTTAYLAVKATFKAADDLKWEQSDLETKEKARIVWKHYVPAGISGAATIGCIIGASKASGRKTAAAMTAYSLTERAFLEYKEKVVEQVGKNKEQKIRDEIVQDKVTESHPGSKEVIVLGGGNMLVCEMHTGRYFRSDMEALRKAENDINHKIVHQLYVSLDEFYALVGLQNTTDSANLGWDSNLLLELKFTTVLTPDSEPCLAFNYNYLKPL